MAGLIATGCASISTPEGGPRDETPPRLVQASPAPGATNVSGRQMHLDFDEYVNIKDAFTNVVVSPTSASQPRVTATGRRVTILFTDTLQPNTTYSIDFANSISDNNEANELEGFSYTFATMAFGQLSLATGNREYAEMFQDYTANKANQTAERRDAVQFVKQKLDSAQWFIDAIKQRNETLQRTMEAIIYLQRDFFLTGDEATLHPMILKDVAERAGYDISTISRVSNSKYVQTNFGIYPLKYFFSESMQTDTGEEISTREVKKIMKEHVDAEDKRKPLTDEELATILKEKGYVIARRTVAKYREQLGIPVARLRKEI